jgi:hypothetical protein
MFFCKYLKLLKFQNCASYNQIILSWHSSVVLWCGHTRNLSVGAVVMLLRYVISHNKSVVDKPDPFYEIWCRFVPVDLETYENQTDMQLLYL